MAGKLTLASKVKLNDGNSIPMLGLGTGSLKSDNARRAVTWALESGYRHIDTAKWYRNEALVGASFKDSGIAREDIFITTKLWPSGFLNPKRALKKSLKRLDLDYVNLYLVHWPLGVDGIDKKVWRQLEKCKEEGLAKSIGVSNFSEARLKMLLSGAHIPPAVNQIRCSPFVYPKELHKFCKENGIVSEAYSPLRRGGAIDHPILVEIAKKHKATVAQVMLRWALQKDIVVIPRSSSKRRISENTKLYDFRLTKEDIIRIDSISGTK